jgi:glutamate carboxypeptidase
MLNTRIVAFTAIAVLVPGSAAAADAKLLAAAEAEVPRAIGLLETMVNINSGTLNVKGVERVGMIMKKELDALGFKTRWIPMAEIGRAGHLVAEHQGTRGRRMLLIGHLDTVFEPTSPFQKFVRKGDIAEGPGTNDMKDGLAIMVAALRAMKTAGTLDAAHITIVLSGDEENPGRPLAIARRDMREAATRSDVALEFESLAQKDGRDMGSIARRSSSQWTVSVTAKSGHSSGIFSEGAGVGAVYELARIVDTFRKELPEPNATFNVGLLVGGESAKLDDSGATGSVTGKDNIIPAAAVASGDLRTLSNEQTERIRAKMRKIVAASLPGAKAEITFEDGYPAMAPTEGSRALLHRLNELNADAGLPIMGELDPLDRGAGDIAFVADKLDGLIGFGAAGEGGHAPGENVDLTSFDRQVKRAALFMTDLSR